MKRICIFAILAAMLAACSSQAPDDPRTDGQFEMRFIATTSGMSRADVDGIYNKETYPINNLYLTAYLIDQANERQYYFIDEALNYDEAGYWTLADWYWPLQGNMSFLGYWCPKFSRAPGFDVVTDANGNAMPRMTVNATTLDGKSDFLYLSNAGISCPEIGTTKLRYLHGLTWLTISLKAEVLDDGQTSPDPAKTQELIEHLEIHKIVIEDCARKGIATVVPGIGASTIGSTNIDINWKSYDDTDPNNVIDYHRDQVYYRRDTDDPADITSYEWEEVPDGTDVNSDPDTRTSFRISDTAQPLGVYGENDKVTSTFLHEGLLIVPENKTSITIEYTVTKTVNGEVNKTPKIERYVLRDDNVAWLPGFHYDYQIVFRNYDDYETNFEVIPSWEGVTLNYFNYCFFSIGQLTEDGSGFNAGFVIEPLHDGGSALGDEMDYAEGERVF